MSKHTATPWKVDPDNDRKVIGADGSFVADCNGLADEDCDAANAAVIVHRVNTHGALVDALAAVLELREFTLRSEVTKRTELNIVAAARAALAAAKGDA